MTTEEKKDNGTMDGCEDFGCCNPEDFRKMFEKKCKSIASQSDNTDFFTMKEGMMKNMMERCCDSRAEENKSGAKECI